MAGLYRDYEDNAFPVWRSKKLSQELLQTQSRFGVLIPLTHGQTFNHLLKASDKLYNLSPYIIDTLSQDEENLLSLKAQINKDVENTSQIDAKEINRINNEFNKIAEDNSTLLKPRVYGTHLYTAYDKFSLEKTSFIENVTLGNINIGYSNIKDTINTYEKIGSGIGYIVTSGNYMWRQNTAAANFNGQAVSSINPMNNYEFFNDFTVYHNKESDKRLVTVSK